MAKYIKLFNKVIAIKTIGCNQQGYPGTPIPPSVNLFVKVTDGCNAHCPFCSNAGVHSTSSFNTEKLFLIVDELKKQQIIINRINITGGEPSCVPKRVQRILHKMEEEAYQDIHVHLNTNGLLPQSQDLMKHPRWDSISVSLHHYNLIKLSELYDTPIHETALNFESIDMMKVNASCNLVKGYIDSTEEAHHMMDFCLEKGLLRLGFVGLMPVNTYSKNKFVSLDELHLSEIPHCYYTGAKDRGKDCKCSNYIYNNHLKVLDIYMRHYANPQYCESSLLFDGEHLRQGFYTNNIIF